jgi:hypothetical protein
MSRYKQLTQGQRSQIETLLRTGHNQTMIAIGGSTKKHPLHIYYDRPKILLKNVIFNLFYLYNSTFSEP